MPTNTQNLSLITENSTSDSQRKFMTHRMDVNGNVLSNMTKIDDWAGVVNEKLIKLGEVKPSILVEATWASMGYYEATVKDILTYKLGDVITFKPNKDNDGTTTLKVNLLEPKFLMKYATDGSLINLNERDLRINHEYQFRFEGTHWVWQDGSSADQTNVDGVIGNILSVSNDNTISDSGVSVEQVATNKIDIESIRANKADKTYADTQDSLKVDKSQIKNNLTETVEGNVIDATQGKILDDKINVLSSDCLKGCEKNFIKNLNILTKTDVYQFPDHSISDRVGAPPTNWGGDVFHKQHDHSTSGYATQIAQTLDGCVYIREMKISTWATWKQISTTDKIDNLKLLNGWTVQERIVMSKVGNIINFSGILNVGARADWTNIMILPDGYRPNGQTSVIFPLFNSAGLFQGCFNFYHSGEVQVSSIPSTTTRLQINISFIV